MNFIENSIFKDDDYVYLYKYMNDDEKALDIFTEETLYFNQPMFFNDPFDCQFSFENNHKVTIKEITEGLKQKNISKISMSEKFRLKAKASHLIKTDTFFDSVLRMTSESMYITCFSQSPLNLLMWSHYSNKHKGYLVEFKFPVKKSIIYGVGLSANFIPFPVNYSNEYPKINNNDKKDSKTSFQKMILNKSSDWSYEEEFRIIRRGKSLGNIQKYPSGIVLSRVILGINIGNNFKEKLIKAVGIYEAKHKKKLELFTAEKVPKIYALTVPNHPFLDVIANSKKKKIPHQ